MPKTISIIGTGPTGIYTFRNLIEHETPLSIWLFEKGEKAGIGMPYSSETASKAMLANIASIEIPPITMTYLDWMETQSATRLRGYGLDPEDLDARQFTPRLLLGEYFRDQLMDLVNRARERGHEVMINEATEITDIAVLDDVLHLTNGTGAVDARFDRVIVATGHVFPDEDEATRSYFPSPWSGLIDADIPACDVGIMGTSLSSIDAAMAVANQHGNFRRTKGDGLRFTPSTDALKITLMSWTGVLPEADFYCPIPHTPLTHMTEDALENARGGSNIYEAVFALFKAEITGADPGYAKFIGLDNLTADNFADAYFAAREAEDPFKWARENLDEVERNKAAKITVPWRYAILRMHEQVERLVPDFSDADRERFDAGLKTVFTDNYAAVPSESIRRLLALHDAGVLGVLALGKDYTLQQQDSKTVITAQGKSYTYDVFIDARGQKAQTSKDLPFPTLRKALLAEGADIPPVDKDFGLTTPPAFAGKILFGAIPYLMHDRPFVQGITAAAEIGEAMARSVRQSGL